MHMLSTGIHLPKFHLVLELADFPMLQTVFHVTFRLSFSLPMGFLASYSCQAIERNQAGFSAGIVSRSKRNLAVREALTPEIRLPIVDCARHRARQGRLFLFAPEHRT